MIITAILWSVGCRQRPGGRCFTAGHLDSRLSALTTGPFEFLSTGGYSYRPTCRRGHWRRGGRVRRSWPREKAPPPPIKPAESGCQRRPSMSADRRRAVPGRQWTGADIRRGPTHSDGTQRQTAVRMGPEVSATDGDRRRLCLSVTRRFTIEKRPWSPR